MPNTIVCSSSPTAFTNTIITTTSASTPCLLTHPALSQDKTQNSGLSTQLFTQTQSNKQLNLSTSQTSLTNSPSWQVVGGKRKSQSSDNTIKLKIVKTNVTPTTATSNYYNVLPMDEDQSNPTPPVKNPNPVPPPVFIHGVVNFQQMISSILVVLKEEDYTCRSLANNTVKVSPKTIDSYRSLVKHLREQKIIFHTYQAKQDRAYRVVLRHIHHSVPTSVIKEELEFEGFLVRNITNVLQRTTKNPLNLFFIDLEPADNNKKIFELQYLLNTKIAVEPPRKNPTIAQCTRCQQYSHTKAYCTRPYACVKCGGNHSSSTCLKTRDTPATCALCDGAHPANYKGCSVYKDIQALRNNQHTNQHGAPRNAQHNNTATLSTTAPSNNKNSPSPPLTRSHILPGTSYASVAAPVTQNQQSNNGNTDISLSAFLQEFKSMFNQLITQNSMILNMLNTVISKIVNK